MSFRLSVKSFFTPHIQDLTLSRNDKGPKNSVKKKWQKGHVISTKGEIFSCCKKSGDALESALK